MRWLFLFLLALNAAYLSWSYLYADRSRDVAVTSARDVDTIVLLSEVEADAGVIAADADRNGRKSAPLAEAVSENDEADIGEADDSIHDVVAIDASADNAEKTAVAGDASSTHANAPAADEMPRADGDGTTAKAAIRFRCFTLGPFRAMEDLRAVTRDIKDYVAEASFRSREEKEATRFRVYLTQSDGLEGANRLTERLRQQDIRDSFIIARGPLRHSVSLGYFSEKKRAYTHADTIRKKGFDPVVEPVFKTYTLYWLDYRILEDTEIPSEIFENRLDSGAGRLSRPCT